MEIIFDFDIGYFCTILFVILIGLYWISNTLAQLDISIKKMKNKLDQIESSQYLILSNNVNCSKYTYPIDSDNSPHFIPKNVNSLNLQHGYKQYSHYGYNCFTASIDYNYLSMNIKFNYYANCNNDDNKSNQIESWSNQLTFFNIKKISTQISSDIKIINSSQSDWNKRLEYSRTFLNIYLANKKDFNVDEIIIDDIELIDTLINYSNYNKLVIKSNVDYDDNLINAHCESNKITFVKIR